MKMKGKGYQGKAKAPCGDKAKFYPKEKEATKASNANPGGTVMCKTVKTPKPKMIWY